LRPRPAVAAPADGARGKAAIRSPHLATPRPPRPARKRRSSTGTNPVLARPPGTVAPPRRGTRSGGAPEPTLPPLKSSGAPGSAGPPAGNEERRRAGAPGPPSERGCPRFPIRGEVEGGESRRRNPLRRAAFLHRRLATTQVGRSPRDHLGPLGRTAAYRPRFTAPRIERRTPGTERKFVTPIRGARLAMRTAFPEACARAGTNAMVSAPTEVPVDGAVLLWVPPSSAPSAAAAASSTGDERRREGVSSRRVSAAGRLVSEEARAVRQCDATRGRGVRRPSRHRRAAVKRQETWSAACPARRDGQLFRPERRADDAGRAPGRGRPTTVATRSGGFTSSRPPVAASRLGPLAERTDASRTAWPATGCGERLPESVRESGEFAW
jgi:hypothetical protein